MEESNNLWKTECNPNETIYVNLFASGPKTEIHSQIQVQAKNNHESTKLRNKGNDEYQLENWSKAMQFYNQSLCFAETGTENVALAYSNRSACFHSLKFYNESIVDIELAKNAGIPDRLLPKLEQRKQECQKLLNIVERRPIKYELKLDFEANENIPSLANVLEIRRNKEYGRHVIATCDIPAGKTILVENVFLLASEKRQVCNTCFKENRNFIACPQCTEVLYCNSDCMNDNRTHEWECGTFFQYIRKKDDDVDETMQLTYLQMKLQIEAILFAISMFPNVDDLMQFVEDTLSEDVSSELKISSDLKSSYHLFLTLFTMSLAGREDFCKQIFDLVMALPKVNVLFDSKKKQRFLMHLILHHYLIIASNSAVGNSEVMHFNIYSLFNHSCAPNVHFVFEDARRLVKSCVTVRPVRKGDQLCTHYLNSNDVVEMSKEKRQVHLRRSHRFICKCEKCEKSYQSTPEVTKSYARFQRDNFGADDRRMAESCVKFLNKHKRSPWSVEIENISSYYQELLDGRY